MLKSSFCHHLLDKEFMHKSCTSKLITSNVMHYCFNTNGNAMKDPYMYVWPTESYIFISMNLKGTPVKNVGHFQSTTMILSNNATQNNMCISNQHARTYSNDLPKNYIGWLKHTAQSQQASVVLCYIIMLKSPYILSFLHPYQLCTVLEKT